MDAKRFVTGTVVGGVALWASGWVIFTKLFASFYAANAGSAMGVDRPEQILWAVIAANVAYAALVTYVIGGRAAAVSIGQGAVVGAIVGCLMWATVDLVQYGLSNVANLTRTLVDPLLEIVHGGIGGAVIAAVVRGSAKT